jgi:cell division protein FtsB|tara:strand:+ start:78 stop:527 length:450 start_codon:yes stop_codon:yes gene_type:complete
MLGLIKALPIIILVGGLAFGAHKFITGQLETRIDNQQVQIDSLNTINVGLQAAQAIQEDTIRGLEENTKKQVAAMGNLTNRNNELNAERDSYLRIFKDHDFTKLARAKPGMIETRANKATEAVFRSVEEDSRELDDTDTQTGEPNESNN